MSEHLRKTTVQIVRNPRRTWVALACVLVVFFLWYSGLRHWGNSLEIPSPSMSVSIVDRNGDSIGESTSSDGQRYAPVKYGEIPPLIVGWLIALEDRGFRSHWGVSPSGIVRSAWNNVQVGLGQTSAVQWGSTLTMGLARNILGINRNRGWTQKIQEVFLAFRLESKYSKDEILVEYLNRIHFGRLSIGIGAASQAYFGKPLRMLTPAENIAILSMIRNPVQYDPTAEPEAFAKRRGSVISTLVERQVIDPENAKLIREEPLVWTRPKSELPYVTDFLKSVSNGSKSGSLTGEESKTVAEKFSNGGTLSTSIDLGMTDRISAVAESVRTGLQNRNVSDYGILVVDRSTMKVRVLIGGANYQGNAGQVNAVFAPRQVGSTMKPFTYLLGITEKWHSMSDTILDAPASYLTADGNPYEPKNYSLGYRGTISLSEALAGSVNVPAVKIAQEVGVEKLLDFVRLLGVTSLTDSADHYGLALTLGVGEINLWELLRWYSVFANQGKLRQLSVLEDTPDDDGKLVTKPEAVSQIVTTLASHRFKSEEFPTGSALDFGEGHVFVKTGTSRNFRDNYALGFTEHYMIGVWTGNKDGSNMRGVSGASGAGEIFAGIVNELGEAGGKADLGMSPVPTAETPNDFSNDPITVTSPLDGTHYRKDLDTPADRQDVTVKYWSKASYEKVSITLFPENRPSESRVLRDGRIPVGSLPLGNYTIRIKGFLPERTDVAEVRFSID